MTHPFQIIQELRVVPVIATDAVTDEIPDRLRLGSVIAASDTWIARTDHIHDDWWADITRRARSTREATYRTRSALQ